MSEYYLETYKNNIRCNEQYQEIKDFLVKVEKQKWNEHFHWGRMAWMMQHSMLEVDNLSKIAMFRNNQNQIVGLVTFDTEIDDSTYLIHEDNNRELLSMMIDYTLDNFTNDRTCFVVANSCDTELEKLLDEYTFSKTDWKDDVLEINLDKKYLFELPEGYKVSKLDESLNKRQYERVIFKGFDNEGEPAIMPEELYECGSKELHGYRIFVKDNAGNYCAHCGIWYMPGNETAYIEPVVTVPECRNKGFAKAAIYEALNQMRDKGASRAIVLSTMEFYHKLGMKCSSEFTHWQKR